MSVFNGEAHMIEALDFELERYLGRIGYDGDLEVALSTLEALHLHHLSRIPFENIDVLLGRTVSLDLEALQAKLVGGGRGGYCFEQNTLFAAALDTLGFTVATLEARVRPPGVTTTLPRTHMLLRVDVGGQAWIADVGFGGDGPLVPVRIDGTVSEQPDGSYRVEHETSQRLVLRRRWRGAWQDLYAFALTPALAVDFEVAHHFTSTHPSSVFLRSLTVQRSELGVRRILRGRTYTVRRGARETVRQISDAELPALLEEAFGLELPEEDLLRVSDT